VEYGRRWYRQLIFSSDPDISLQEMKTDYLHINGRLALCCGDPRIKYESAPSLIIRRDVKVDSSTTQMFFPSRFLSGILPSILLNQYKFWQNEDDSLVGYMPDLESNKSVIRSILNVDMLRIGLKDSTGYCNALADSLISRVFVAESASQNISDKEFNSRPDTSKPTEFLVNLVAVLSHYVKKYNNASDPIGPVPKVKGLVDFKGESSTLHALVRLTLRLDCLANILAWSKSDPTVSPQASISIDSIELPRLRLTFEKKISATGNVQYFCAEQSGMFLTGYDDSLRFVDLLEGLPRTVLLANTDHEYFVMLPAIAKPVLTRSNSSGVMVYSMLMSVTNNLWLANTGDSAYFIYPIHSSGCFMSSRSIASSLYLLVLRLMSHNYRDAFRLIESCVCDSVLTPQEKQIYDVIATIKDDLSPDMHACRLKLYFVTYGCSDVMPYQFDVEKELAGYVMKIKLVSSYCKLSPDEETFIINQVPSELRNAHITNRERIIRASFTLTFDVTISKLSNRKFTPIYPKLVVSAANSQIVDLDSLDPSKPTFKGILSKLAIVRYSRPEACQGPAAITYLNQIFEDEKNLGFFFLYEILTDAVTFRILPDDPSHNVGSVLLRFLPENYISGIQGAILRVVESHPEISTKMPVFEDKRRLKLPSFAGLDLFQTHIQNAATTVRTHISEINIDRISVLIPAPFKPPVTLEAAPTLQDGSNYIEGRTWLNPRIADFKRPKRLVGSESVPTSLTKLRSHYVVEEVSHLVDTPLGAIDLLQYVEYMGLTGRGETTLSGESPLRVMQHPSSNSHIARSNVNRLEQDIKDFSNDENKSVLPVLKAINTKSDDLKGAGLDRALISLSKMITALEMIRDKDHISIVSGVEELLNYCNSTLEGSQGNVKAIGHTLRQKSGTEVPMVSEILF
jgi:hypothetical protein